MNPNTWSYIYNCNTFPNFTSLNAKLASQLCNVVSPKFYEVPHNMFVSVTRVDWMNVEQTGNWVRTLVNSRGWKHGDDYAKNFKEQKINGLGLQHLTRNMLEVRLGVKSLKHRLYILSTIRYLYWGFPMACDYLSSDAQSSASELECKISASKSDGSDVDRNFSSFAHSHGIDQCVESETESCANSSSAGYSCNTSSSSGHSSESKCGREHEMNGLSKLAMTVARKSYTDVENRKRLRMYPMSNHRQSLESNAGFLNKTPVKSRKLRVTINPEQDNGPETTKRRIRNRFQELNIWVEDVMELKNKQNVYVVVFTDYRKALDALSRSEEIGLHLRMQWPKSPGPQCVRTFKALMRLPILSGKSLTKSKFKDWLPEGAIVRVNQLKRRRARLIKEEADGNVIIIGWVNMKMENGVRCLEQVDDM